MGNIPIASVRDEEEEKPVPLIFEQIIDHDSDLGYFNQTYYVYDKLMKEGGPVILYIGGESDTFKPKGFENDFCHVLAKELGGMVISVEHRFFGTSQPFEEATVENLRYLTVDQELKDLAFFREEYSQAHNLTDNKWIAVGGSYPGMIAALLRREYPDLFHIALSSSGVVYATKDFKDFDMQIAISMGQECAAVARTTRMRIDELLDEDPEYVYELFNASGFTPDVFRFVVGEMFTIAPQYGSVESVCGALLEASRSGTDYVTALAKFARNYFTPKFCDGDMYHSYANEDMKKVQPVGKLGPRCWLWMTCNELAYWQVYPGNLGLRSPRLTQAMYKQQCRDVFDQDMDPDVDAFNKRYGGFDQPMSHVFYTTGSQDPWTHACITDEKLKATNSVAHTMVGDNVGHCRDLHEEKIDDPYDVIMTRKKIIKTFKKWLAEEDDEE